MSKVFFLAFVVLLSAYAVLGQATPPPAKPAAQQTPSTPELDDVNLRLAILTAELGVKVCAISPNADSCKERPAEQLVKLYSQAISRPAVLRSLLASGVTTFTFAKENARGAAQVSQGADEANVSFQLIIIAQNQRIIELLEQLNKKK